MAIINLMYYKPPSINAWSKNVYAFGIKKVIKIEISACECYLLYTDSAVQNTLSISHA